MNCQKIKTTSLVMLAATTAWLSGCAAQMGTEEEAGQTQDAVLKGLILQKYNQLGGANSLLGKQIAPADEQPTFFNEGKYNNFEHGIILWKYQATEAFAVYLNFYDTYGYLGREWGMLGFPIEREQYVVGDRKGQKFENGYTYYKNGFSWPVMATTWGRDLALNHQATHSWPSITSGSLPPSVINTTCLKGAKGTGFKPNTTITFYLNSPTASPFITQTNSDANGNFSFDQKTNISNSDCFSMFKQRVNGVATIEARDGAHRAVFPIRTTAGSDYVGTL